MKITGAIVLLYLSGIFSIISSINAAETKKIYTFPPEKSAMIIEWAAKCMNESGVDISMMDELKQGKYTDDDRLMEALLCANKGIGYVTDKGTINIEKSINDLFPKKTYLRADFEACNKDCGPNPVGTFKAFLICFRKRVPFRVVW